MAINTLAFQTKLAQELDKELVQKSVTGFMADTPMRQKFVGARTVLLPDISFQGLGNYDRDDGFPRGAVTVSHNSYTLTQDRGRTFSIDREDMDETGVAGLAGRVMSEFVRTEVVPEVDAYTLSKLCQVASDAAQTVTLGQGEALDTHVYKLLNAAIRKVHDVVGYDEEIVAFINPTLYGALMDSEELSRHVEVSDFKKGNINTRVQMLNNVALLPVPEARMKTAYTFGDGTSDGQTDGGFAPTGNAKNIGLLVLPKKAGLLVKKTDKIRTFTPDQNQAMDAYKFDYRLYYDALVKKSMAPSIFTYVY